LRMKSVGLFIATLCIVSGWFFARNWLELGKPFYGGWDPSRSIVWWQEPGYRILRDYLSFGEALKQPMFAAFYGFADAVYSTFWADGYNSGMVEVFDWNYLPLAAGTAFSVIPALSMAVGLLIAFWQTCRKEWWPNTFLFASIGIYLAGLFHLYSSVPIFSTAKASYTMGLTPAYAVMAAIGAERFIHKKYLAALFVSLLVTWGALTYIGFFVV